MSAPTGPSHFVDVSGVAYNSINIYSVMSISIRRNRQLITGEDNNKLRPVSSHTVRIGETVTLETEDGYALEQLLSQTGAHDLTFTWRTASQQLNGTALANQTVTIKNVVWQSISPSMPSKGISRGSAEGIVLEVSDDTDPVVFA